MQVFRTTDERSTHSANEFNFPPKKVINKTLFSRVEIIIWQFWKFAYLVYFRMPKEE